jgi:hypothetical protein
MKPIQIFLVALFLCVNFVIAPNAWADRGKLMKSPDYAEVTQAISELLKTQDSPDQKPEAFQQKITELQWQKYLLETAEEHAQCANETGKTLAIYAQPKKAVATQPPTLYFLGNGQVTDDDYVCSGVYLPSGTKVSFSLADRQGKELSTPTALRILDGTQLVATTNPNTGLVSLNLPPTQVFAAGEGPWAIPNLTQADIDTAKPNAPQD